MLRDVSEDDPDVLSGDDTIAVKVIAKQGERDSYRSKTNFSFDSN